jgi:predicted acyltransferase
MITKTDTLLSTDAQIKKQRITAIDQLRGYAIFGMLLVNASSLFSLNHEQLMHHREIFTYADSIAPLFLFVVGLGMRLSWLRRNSLDAADEIRRTMIKRYTLLVLIAFVIYGGWLWDALMDIGLAGLIAVWFVDKKPRIRVFAAFTLVAIYQAIVMFSVYGAWITRTIKFTSDSTPLLIKLIPLNEALFAVPMNGGPLGPLSWCMMLLFGTIAYDLMAGSDRKVFILGCLGWGLGLCAAGYILHLPWGQWKEAWPISAYYMTAPFPLWSTGLCFIQLLIFYLLCDIFKWRIPTFSAVGMNPLFIYILHLLVLDVIGGFETPELVLPVGVAGFLVFYGCFAILAWWMQHRRIYIKI